MPVGVRVLVAVEAPPVGVRVGVFVLVAPGTGVLVALAPPKSVASAMILFCTDTPYGLLGVKLVFVPVSRHGQPSLSNIQAVQLMWRVPLFISLIKASVSDCAICPPVPNSVTSTGYPASATGKK